MKQNNYDIIIEDGEMFVFRDIKKSWCRQLKEFIADQLDAICAETFEPENFFSYKKDGNYYVAPIPKA